MFHFLEPRPIRRIGLTPMIDVVFLLLVFFMLVARFGADRAIPLDLAGGGSAWRGPPRLVEIAPGGLRLNGVAMGEQDLLGELVRLTGSGADPVLLAAAEGVDTQRLIGVMDLLGRAGFTSLALVEPR